MLTLLVNQTLLRVRVFIVRVKVSIDNLSGHMLHHDKEET